MSFLCSATLFTTSLKVQRLFPALIFHPRCGEQWQHFPVNVILKIIPQRNKNRANYSQERLASNHTLNKNEIYLIQVYSSQLCCQCPYCSLHIWMYSITFYGQLWPYWAPWTAFIHFWQGYLTRLTGSSGGRWRCPRCQQHLSHSGLFWCVSKVPTCWGFAGSSDDPCQSFERAGHERRGTTRTDTPDAE